MSVTTRNDSSARRKEVKEEAKKRSFWIFSIGVPIALLLSTVHSSAGLLALTIVAVSQIVLMFQIQNIRREEAASDRTPDAT